MTDHDRTELAKLMVATLPKFGTWANTIKAFKTPFGTIGYRQAAILWAIRYCLIPENEVSPSRLATLHHVRPSAITHALARLEEARFIVHNIDPRDGRRFRISITDAGRQISEYIDRTLQ